MTKIPIILTIFAIISLLLIILIIYPLFKGIKKSSQELISSKQTLVSLQSKINNLERFKEINEGLGPSLTIMDSLFVNADLPIDFIKFLEKIASDTKLSINVSPATAPKKGTDLWPSISFQISLNGSLPNCLRFFEKIEVVPYLVEAQNFSVKRIGEEPQENAMANLSIKVFSK